MSEALVLKRITISCSHHIPNHNGKCARPHGHNYIIEVGVQGPIDQETGMVKDFYEVKKDLEGVIDTPCDHRNLNEVYPFMLTTAENLACYWLGQLIRRDSRYSFIRVYETPDSWVEVRAGDLS